MLAIVREHLANPPRRAAAAPAVPMPISRNTLFRNRRGSGHRRFSCRDLASRGMPASHGVTCAKLKSLLLLFPEGQQALRRRASDHAGNADRDLPKRRRGNASERERADADLAPEVEVAPAIRALGLELFHGGERILADRAE